MAEPKTPTWQYVAVTLLSILILAGAGYISEVRSDMKSQQTIQHEVMQRQSSMEARSAAQFAQIMDKLDTVIRSVEQTGMKLEAHEAEVRKKGGR